MVQKYTAQNVNLYMAKKYDIEFKEMEAELLISGVSTSQVSSEYNLNGSMIRRWRKEYSEKGGDMSKPKTLTDEQHEIKRLKKDLKETQLERDILKKAVTIFSKSDR